VVRAVRVLAVRVYQLLCYPGVFLLADFGEQN